MWVIKKINEGTTQYLITEKHSYVVGRKNCDIILENDSSISRKHCTIYVSKQQDCPFSVDTFTGLWIVDENSKYGTYLKNNNEWIKLNPHHNKKISSGSVIKFGLMENIWSVEFKPVVVCASGIQTEQKKTINDTLKLIDGQLRNVITNECSLIVVNEITLTVKVVLALINGIPIVTPNYLNKLVECIKGQTSFPDYKDYKPEIKESILDESLVSLNYNETRKELFKGKTFIIPTKKQLETLKEVILSAGGKVQLLSELSGSWEKLAEENNIIIQMSSNISNQSTELINSFKEITSLLKNKYGKRIVPESEIAQAVAYSSIEKYCNPKSTCFELRRSSKDVEYGVVLVEETPELTKEHHADPQVIPSSSALESQTDSLNEICSSVKSNTGRKRGHPADITESKAHKRKAVEKNLDLNKEQTSISDALIEKVSSQDRTKRSEFLKEIHSSSQKSKNLEEQTTITKYFRKQNITCEKTNLKVEKNCDEFISNSENYNEDNFWNTGAASSNFSEEKERRKRPADINLVDKDIQKKKTKFSEKAVENCLMPKMKELEFSELNTVSNKLKTNENSSGVNKKECLPETDFFGKEIEDTMGSQLEELNNTIFSLKIFASAFLKEDGSLVDPPRIPVNVKKFKKQKICSAREIVPSKDPQSEILEEGWIEPHPLGVNVAENYV